MTDEANRTQGETLGPEQEPTEAGDQDPATRAPRPDGLYLNGGYSGHGIMAGTGGSRRVVDLITGVADADANPFRPDRAIDVREHDIL